MAKVILNIGHGGITRDPGAIHYGVKEHQWNKDLVENYIIPKLKEEGIESAVVVQTIYKTLYQEINKVANKGDITLSFHLNSSEPHSNGTEMLYYEESKNSKRLASILQEKTVEALGLRNRGIKGKNLKDRGGSVLVRTSTPCVILEPGFLSNEKDLESLNTNKEKYADAIVASIKEYLGV